MLHVGFGKVGQTLLVERIANRKVAADQPELGEVGNVVGCKLGNLDGSAFTLSALSSRSPFTTFSFATCAVYDVLVPGYLFAAVAVVLCFKAAASELRGYKPDCGAEGRRGAPSEAWFGSVGHTINHDCCL